MYSGQLYQNTDKMGNILDFWVQFMPGKVGQEWFGVKRRVCDHGVGPAGWRRLEAGVGAK